MKKILFLLGSLSLFVYSTSAVLAKGRIIEYFYGQGCPHCAKVEEYFQKNNLEKKYPLVSYEIYYNRANADKLNEYFNTYRVKSTERGVPIVFFGDKYLVGDRDIITQFAKLADLYLSAKEGTVSSQISGNSRPIQSNLTLVALFMGALTDAFNPCMLGFLIVLLAGTMIMKKDKIALYCGLAYSVAVFIIHLLMGLGFYKILSLGSFPYTFTKIVGLISIFLGILNLKDFIWYGGGGFVMETPRSWRPYLRKILRAVTNPLGAFLAGLIVSSIILPCTSGPYLVILSMLSQKVESARATVYLVLYNLVFVLPLVTLSILAYKGLEPERVEEIRAKNLRVLHLIAGILLILMGVIIIKFV